MRLLLSLILLGVLTGSLHAADAPAEVNFQRDITYAKVAGEDLQLNLARPKEAKGKLPCVVFIHGGGWTAGHRNAHDPQTWQMAQLGYVSATVSYRFTPKYPFPAQIQDVKAAVRYLRAHAEEYNIDPDRIGAVGFSAGAHLAMILATMDKQDGLDDSGGNEDFSSKVQCAVSFFGPTDLTKPYPEASRKLVLQFVGDPEKNAEAYKKASPITYVSAGDPPMLLFQGTNDNLVPYQQAIYMLDAMEKFKVPGRVEMLSGAGHGWGGQDLERTMKETVEFLAQHLKKPAPKAK